jgi:hypothetical protein
LSISEATYISERREKNRDKKKSDGQGD